MRIGGFFVAAYPSHRAFTHADIRFRPMHRTRLTKKRIVICDKLSQDQKRCNAKSYFNI